MVIQLTVLKIFSKVHLEAITKNTVSKILPQSIFAMAVPTPARAVPQSVSSITSCMRSHTPDARLLIASPMFFQSIFLNAVVKAVAMLEPICLKSTLSAKSPIPVANVLIASAMVLPKATGSMPVIVSEIHAPRLDVRKLKAVLIPACQCSFPSASMVI